jgi:prophage regulatory protein
MKQKSINTPVSVLKAVTPTIDNQVPVSLINSHSEHINALPVRFLRKREVMQLTGLSSSGLYALMAIGKFPKSIKLSEKSVAWVSTSVLQWQAERLAANGVAVNDTMQGA